MTTEKSSNGKCFVYVGLAGETAPGRVVASGLFRMAEGDDQWELLANGLPEAPAVRAIAIHPKRSNTMFVGTQDGPYRTEDHGDHWEKVNVPDHGLPVWSLLFHPRDPNVMFAGYESSEIYRSDDGGERWQQLPVSVRFPEVTVGPGANLAKRVLQIAAVPSNSDELYGAIEVGGIIRSSRWRRTLGAAQPRAVRQRRSGGHARGAGQRLPARQCAWHRPRRHVPERRQGRPLGQGPSWTP